MGLFSHEPQQAPNWYVAATHYLTSGLVAPTLISGAAYLSLGLLLPNIENVFLNMVTGFIISILSLWLGIIYSKNYLDRTYIIKDCVRVVNLSTMYYLIAGYIWIGLLYFYDFLYVIAQSLSGRAYINHLTKEGDLPIMALFILIETYIFYTLSKKYLQPQK